MRRGGGGSRAVLRDEATAGRGAAATESACRRVRGERAWREAGCERGEARTKGRESGGRSGGAGRTTDERREEAAGGQGVSLRCVRANSRAFLSRDRTLSFGAREGGGAVGRPTTTPRPSLARDAALPFRPTDSDSALLSRRIRACLGAFASLSTAPAPFAPFPLFPSLSARSLACSRPCQGPRLASAPPRCSIAPLLRPSRSAPCSHSVDVVAEPKDRRRKASPP